MNQQTKHTRVVFLCSGNGGNLRGIRTAVENGWLNHASIVAVLTDRQCGSNDYACDKRIANKCIDFTNNEQSDLLSALNSYEPDIIITNVHRMIKPQVVDAYNGKLVNLHYSLLPSFGGSIGQKPVENALGYGAKFIGTTVHFVDHSLDGGKPIAQVTIPVSPDESSSEIMDIVFRCGYINLFAAIRDFHAAKGCTRSKMLFIKDRDCFFNPNPDIPEEMNTQHFWDQLRTA